MTTIATPTTVQPGTRRDRASIWTVVEYQFFVARAFLPVILMVGIVTPLLYVLSLGVGLGSIVDDHGNTLGVKYIVFVAPAFLTAAALQIAANEASFPLFGGFKWNRTFHGMIATPLTTRQVCDGELAWIAIRLFGNSSIYLAIMASFGAVNRPLVLLCVPIATLTGLAFAASVAAVAATIENEGSTFNVLFRFVVTPMFLFSGTFYPISQLPTWGQWLAHISPLWHGTELARATAIGRLSGASIAGHLAFLVVWLGVAVALARWRFRVKLEK